MTKCRFDGVSRETGLLLLLATCSFGTFVAGAQVPDTNRTSTPRKPCILLIVADDLGYGDLGCYGQTNFATPNIDKLAAEGMRFTSFYAGSSVATPSRAALLTGKHTGHSGIRGNDGFALLAAGEPTLANVLGNAGYSTAAIGVWGLGDINSSIPCGKGFREWFGYLGEEQADNYYPASLDRARIMADTGELKQKLQPLAANADGKQGKYADDLFTEVALTFLKQSKPEWFNQYRPFFLYLPYTIARANMALARQTGNGMEVPDDSAYSGKPWSEPQKNRAAMVTRLDGYVGRLMDQLSVSNVDKNTLVIFTSVNGPAREGGVDPKFFHSAGLLRGMKHEMYEGGIRVPFIVRWPVRITGGRASDLPCAAWDLLATASDIVRAPVPDQTDGISFLPTLTGQSQTNKHDFLYWELHDHGFKQAARMGDWKVVRAGVDGPLELYDLKSDSGETNNVAEKNPEIVAKFNEYLKRARSDDKNWPVPSEAASAQK